MISAESALRLLEENWPTPETVSISIEEALGRVLAENVLASEPSPRYSSSSMDGYAVCWKAEAGDLSKKYQIIGESQAGIPFEGSLAVGQAARVSTGARLPVRTDSVVRIEDTQKVGESIEVTATMHKGQFCRIKGEEFLQDDILLRPGVKLGPKEIGLLAYIGVQQVAAYATPEVVLLTTGTELQSFKEESLKSFQIRDSNRPMLTTAVTKLGGSCSKQYHVKDDFDETVSSIITAHGSGADIILSSGGVSVGKHDHIKRAAIEAGFKELFWGVQQKPGKPLFAAKRDRTLFFGLPGNPVSSFMCFHHYVAPTILAMQGRKVSEQVCYCAVKHEMVNDRKQTRFIRVRLVQENGDQYLIPIQSKDTYMLTSIVDADGFLTLMPESRVQAGSRVPVYLF